MLPSILKQTRSSVQFKLFLSLTAIVALSMSAILVSQVYLIQDYFIRQAESNLRSSNYLLSRVLADPLFSHDLSLLQTRLQDVQTKLPLCNFQLKDNTGRVVYKVGDVKYRIDTELDPDSRDGCYDTIIPVIHASQFLGTVRLGVRTDEIAHAKERLIQQSAFLALFWFALFMLPFFIQIRRMVRPLTNLSTAAQQIANGDLDYPAPPPVHGDDEIARLTTSFQAMAQALVRNRDNQAAYAAALSNEKSTLDALLTTMPLGVIFADHTRIRYCNEAFRRLFLLDPKEQVVGMTNEELLLRAAQRSTNADSFLQAIAEILETRELVEPKYVCLKDGRILRMTSNVVPAGKDDAYLGRFWLFEDATDEQQQLRQAEQLAEHDALTSLYNRHRFDEDLKRLIAQAERDDSKIGLLIFDLDDFKPINDLYGHASGDVVLQQIAHALQAQLRRNEVLYRIGGDEFALLMINASDEEVMLLAQRIVSTIHSLTFSFSNDTTKVGCSLGVARYPYDATTVETLLQHADLAMYAAKNNGKNRYVLENIALDASRRLKLKEAANESPIVDMKLGIAILDAQHNVMENLIKGIVEALNEGDRSFKLHKRIDLLYDLTQIHFQTEEDLMRKHGVAGLDEHHAEHLRRLARLRTFFSNLNLSKQELETLTLEIKEWMHGHIRGQDLASARQLRSQGIS
jgi:diguanylate cyclase (GGDEF)-like protein/hemerythrin-like metal-binding protein